MEGILDFKKHFITRLYGNEGSIQDGALYNKAWRGVLNNIGPLGGRPLSGRLGDVDKVDKIDDAFGYNPKERDNAVR